MKLFQPNNLSKRTPEFIPLHDRAITAQVVSLLTTDYGFPANINISVFSGANISSQNFKVETPQAKAFLKSRDILVAEKMLCEAKLTVSLSELGQRVPPIIRS